MLMLSEVPYSLPHFQSLNSGILVEGFIRQLKRTDTVEDTLITFPRHLLQMCISVVLKVLCVVIAWEALKTCMLQHYLEPTEPRPQGSY